MEKNQETDRGKGGTGEYPERERKFQHFTLGVIEVIIQAAGMVHLFDLVHSFMEILQDYMQDTCCTED